MSRVNTKKNRRDDQVLEEEEGQKEENISSRERDRSMPPQTRSDSKASANSNIASKLRSLFQKRIVQVESTKEDVEPETTEADEEEKEIKEKNIIKQKLLKLALERKKNNEKLSNIKKKIVTKEDTKEDEGEEEKANGEEEVPIKKKKTYNLKVKVNEKLDDDEEEEREELKRIREINQEKEALKKQEEEKYQKKKEAEELKRKEELNKLKEKIKKQEELRKEEEERRLKEKQKEEERLKKLKEEEKEREKERLEKQRAEEEERQLREKFKREEAERRRKEEERQKEEEERRQKELERQKEEEERKRKEEEQRKKIQEEMQKLEEIRQKQMEEQKRQEEQRKLEEQKRKEEETKRREEEQRKLEEFKKKEEELQRREEELKKKEEEARLREIEEQKKRKIRQELERHKEEERLKEEKKRKKDLEKEKRKLELKFKEERLVEEARRRQEEEDRLFELQQNGTPNSQSAKRERYQTEASYMKTPLQMYKENQLENSPMPSPTYQKPHQKPALIYNPKKLGMRGRSIERSKGQQNTSSNSILNNTQLYTNPQIFNDFDIPSYYGQNNSNRGYQKSPNRMGNNNFYPATVSQSSKQLKTYDYDYTSPFQQNDDYSLQINLEDLMVLEEKLSEILTAMNEKRTMSIECFEWWNFYFNCSLFKRIEKAFKDDFSRRIIESSINNELLSIIICYDVSFDKSMLTHFFVMIKAILQLNHENLILICEYILGKISAESLNNIWVYKLRNLVTKAKSTPGPENDYDSFEGDMMNGIEKIRYNTNCISSDIKIILKNYPTSPTADNLVSLYKSLNKRTYEEINDFFRSKIMRVDNPKASVLASVVLKENQAFSTVEPPYIKTPNIKPYTLVLDLDETIIHFKVNPKNDTEGVLKVRPGIYEFLETLGKYYEIIVWTAATQDYADLLIDSIEENNIYFDFRFYRQHAVIVDNDFVKDLTRIGRSLDKIIIVDNMPQNFRLQKENGINIRAFWGEDVYDTALSELMSILVNIAKEGGDVRKGLAKYRNDIVRKVTTNISKHVN